MSWFLVYGLIGLGIEVLFTGILLTRDRFGTGYSFAVMLPLYGVGGMMLERVLLHPWPFPLVQLAATGLIFALEFGYGLLLLKTLGRCPWDYGEHRFSVGLGGGHFVRLDFAPWWFALATCFGWWLR